MRRVITNILGVLATVFLMFHWVVLLNPLKWNLAFPGGIRGAFLTMLLAMLGSLAAGIWGKRLWFIVAAANVLTFIYYGVFDKSPYLY